jgi:peptidoglycan/LPS O-acetylase OafA/YrhL
MKKRLIVLDFYKIMFALSVFWRHSITMGGCIFTYLRSGFMTRLSTNAMSAFFIVSGFSLYYVYQNEDFSKKNKMINFYKKRFLSIFLIYLLVVIAHFIFLERDVSLNLGLFPIEITGTQMFFDHTGSYLHNGTTWFVSCIILSYFIFPILNIMLSKSSKKSRLILFAILLLFLIYSPYMFAKYGISSTYSNPLFRAIEFCFGVSLCSIMDIAKEKISKIPNIVNLIISLLAFVGFVLIYWYDWSLWPKYILIALMFYFGALYKNNEKRKYQVLTFLVSLSYPFYIFQDFIWSKNKWLIEQTAKISDYHLKFFVYFAILMVLSILAVYLYQKPLQKLLQKKWIKKV